jgi:hypothetical protein
VSKKVAKRRPKAIAYNNCLRITGSGIDEPWYDVMSAVARESPIDNPDTIFDGSVTGVGREQDRTSRYPETQKALRNRHQRTSENRIESPYSAYESEDVRVDV